MAFSDYPGGFANGLNVLGIPILNTYGNKVYWVDSNTGSDGNKGTFNKPFASIDYAIGRCTASKGDIILVKAGHAETLTAAIAADVAGISIVGLGNGENRPTLTLTATAAPAITVSAANTNIANIRFYCATAGSSYLKNLLRIAADNTKVLNCEFTTNQVMTHTVRIVSGNKVEIKDCVFKNKYAPGAGAAGIKAQQCILNIGGTNVWIKSCRFVDIHADKAHRWKAVIEGGKLTASLTVEDCTFVCRGIATRTRTAGASGYMATLFCRAVSPSSNTSSGATYTPTYQYIIQSYDVNAVNKVGVVSVTTSDRTLKTDIEYLEAA